MSGDATLHLAVQDFLFHEAELLDNRRLRDWLALFTADAEYWVPMAWDQASPRDHVSLYWEDMTLLKMRVERLEHEATVSQWPVTRTHHHVGNLRVAAAADGVEATSYLLYAEYRRDEQRWFSARCRHNLVRGDGGFRIRRKRVDLLNCDQDSGHLRLATPF